MRNKFKLLQGFCKKAAMSAVRENFVRKKTQSDFKIMASHFKEILNPVRSKSHEATAIPPTVGRTSNGVNENKHLA